MSEPVFFVVEATKGGNGEFPAIYHDRLPERLTAKDGVKPIYVCRLDLLDAADYASMSLDQLHRRYRIARDAGRLPQNVAQK